MAFITLAGTLLDPNGDLAVGDQIRFTHNSTTGETVKSAVSVITIDPSGAYSLPLQYGLVLVEYKDVRNHQFKNLGVATVNQDNPATSIPELLNALVPVSSAELIEFQAILADAVTAKEAAELAANQFKLDAGASLIGVSSGSNVQAEIDSLVAGQTGGIITFTTYALLDAYTPLNVTEQKTSFKVTNDANTSLNGYYHWVSGTAYAKDSDLVVNVIDENNNSDAISGSAVFGHVLFADANGTQIFNSYPDELFTDQLFVKESGTGDVTYEMIDGVPSVRFTNCVGRYYFAADPDVYDKTKPWGFAYRVESVTGSARVIAHTSTVSGGGQQGTRYDEQINTVGEKSGDGFLGNANSNFWFLYVDANNDDIAISNIFVGNCVNVRYIPFDELKPRVATLEGITESNFDRFVRSQLRNLIPNNLFNEGITGWDEIPAGAVSATLTQTIETGSTPLNNKFMRGVAGDATSTNNFFGTAIALDVSYLDVGDTLVFNGLIRKSVGTLQPWIELRTKNAALATLTTIQSADITENSTDWIDSGEVKITIDATTEWLYVFVRDIDLGEHIDISGWSFTKESLPGKYYFPTSSVGIDSAIVSSALFVDGAAGDDTNDGTATNPFATIGKAMAFSATEMNAKIIVSGGVYRESHSFLDRLEGSKITIQNALAAKVIVSGADALSSFTKTGGYTNIYQAAFAGVVPTYPHSKGKLIFEDGRNSKTIVDYNALQRGLTHRLPYTEITEESFDTNLTTTLTNMDGNSGNFYLDSGVLYVHATDSDNPTSNGYSYEIPVRDTTLGSDQRIDVNLEGISYRYSDGVGLALGKVNLLTRYSCSVFAAVGDGFNDNANRLISYKDESAGCGNDGVNGHFNSVTDYLLTDQRNGSNQAFIFDAWCHDNADDGLSFHERGECNIYGSLFEFNGDRGIAPASGCNLTAYNSTFRNNGQQVPIDPGAGGEGVCVINASIDGRNGTNCTLISCVSEENQVGYRATTIDTNRITLINSISRNNVVAELMADDGSIVSKNTLATNSDSLKLKVTSGTGSITIENDTLLT